MRNSLLFTAIGICGVLLPSLGVAATAGLARRSPVTSSSMLLESSGSIARATARVKAVQVKATLDLRLVDSARYLTPEQLRIAQGFSDEPLEAVEIHARQGIDEANIQAPIPFGLAGLYWGARHPGEAWRLLLPVLRPRQ